MDNQRPIDKDKVKAFTQDMASGKFKVGDMVVMPGIPISPVKVLEIKRCDDEQCPFEGQEVFRFTDPSGAGEDWMHTSEFEKA